MLYTPNSILALNINTPAWIEKLDELWFFLDPKGCAHITKDIVLFIVLARANDAKTATVNTIDLDDVAEKTRELFVVSIILFHKLYNCILTSAENKKIRKIRTQTNTEKTPAVSIFLCAGHSQKGRTAARW